MSRTFRLILSFLLFQSFFLSAQGEEEASLPEGVGEDGVGIELPDPLMEGVEQEVTLTLKGQKDFEGSVPIEVNGKERKVHFEDGSGIFTYKFEDSPLVLRVGAERIERPYQAIPLWTSLLPPLLAILLALVLREVYASLFTGILLGAVISLWLKMGLLGVFVGFFRTIDTYILGALNNSGHLSVILFSTMIGGVVAVISRNGGMQGVVNRISRGAVTAKRGQMSTWGLGIAIFFDDYANTLVVGNTMRPVTDRLRISREKLAYLVDSTAAPIAAVAFITTWIGAELGYIQGAMDAIEAKKAGSIDESVYGIFMNSLAYSFYPLLTLIFIPILVLKGKDFGPMLKAERRSRLSSVVEEKSEVRDEKQEERAYKMEAGLTPNAWFALLPILTIILGTFAGLLITGWQDVKGLLLEKGMGAGISVWGEMDRLDGTPNSFLGKLGTLIGSSDAYASLLWASLAALVLAVLMSVLSGRMKLERSMEALLDGFRTMLGTIIVLILAWSLAKVTEDLHTAEMLASLMGEGVSPWAVPSIAFLLAAAVAFSTGSSWGTMAILYPLLLPTVWQIGMEQLSGPEAVMPIFYNVTSCVLAGSVLGDHCSPISDTTILSSLASSCDHIAHVRTQMPYALTVGAVALLVGTLPSALGVPFWLTFPAGVLILYGIVHFFGRSTEEELPFERKL